MTRPFFTRERISDFEIYHRNSNIALRTAKSRLAEGFPLNFQVCYLHNIIYTQYLNNVYSNRTSFLALPSTRPPNFFSDTWWGH
jgi:hypothetical protein